MIRCLALLVLPGWAPGLGLRWEGQAGAPASLPSGQKMCTGRGPPRAHRVHVFLHELEGHGGPCFSAAPPAPSTPLPIHVRTVPQVRELTAEMVGGADEEKGAVCAGNSLQGCSSRHWVFLTRWLCPSLLCLGKRDWSLLTPKN